MSKRLPIGMEDFEDIRRQDLYYVDKTELIAELFENFGKVTLFTRPRRFGKTLTMSMFRHFLEIGADASLFDGLSIMKHEAICREHMGKYPVIFVSLKDVDGLKFANARRMLGSTIRAEASRHYELKTSEKVSAENRKIFEEMLLETYDNLENSLRLMSEMLYQHYGQKVVILIDEYDVPLDKAFSQGYYSEMVALIRGLLGQALKTNPYLQLAILTGCLRISRESIFTGLNNFSVNTITDVTYDEYFGFTEAEVQELLREIGFADRIALVKEWYDGYRFGNADIYCPWDVIQYAARLRADADAEPEAFWIHTSSNSLVRRFVNKADQTTRDELERLVAGETIEKSIRQELTYEELDSSIENLWSVLFTTGYLTLEERPKSGNYRLRIPNREVQEVYISQIQEWFRDTVMLDTAPLQALYSALSDGDADETEKRLNAFLAKTISIQDTRAREGQKENFYHGFLLGLLQGEPSWGIRSNREAGNGFCDIFIRLPDPNRGIVIEIKYAPAFSGLEGACKEALQQIQDRHYDEVLREDGREDILVYGIAFCKKRCRVAAERM